MFMVVFLGFFGLFLLAGAAVLGLYGWRNQRTASLLGCPLSRIAKLRPGYRKVRGKVAAIGEPLNSPVSNRPCVYYQLRICENRTTYKNTSSLPGGTATAFMLGGVLGALIYRAWNEPDSDTRSVRSLHTLLDAACDIPLVIEDDTGCVEVDLRDAAVVVKDKIRVVSNDTNRPPSHLEELLREEHDIHTVDSRGFAKTLHFIEEALVVGAKVTVVGPVKQLKSGDLCFQHKGEPLLVSEHDVAKEGRAARGRATGFLLGAGGALVVGLGCLAGVIVLVVRASLTR